MSTQQKAVYYWDWPEQLQEDSKLSKEQQEARRLVFGTDPEEKKGSLLGIVFENGEFKLKSAATGQGKKAAPPLPAAPAEFKLTWENGGFKANWLPVKADHKEKGKQSLATNFFNQGQAANSFQDAFPKHIKNVRRL